MIDPQKNRVYEAEWAMSCYNWPRFKKSETAQKWANELVGSAWFGRNWPFMQHHPVTIFEIDSEQATSYPVSNTLDMPKWAWSKLIILHEIAHLCNEESEAFQRFRVYEGLGRTKKKGLASHGKRFCGIYLKLVEHVMGLRVARELKANFDKMGVQYESKRWKSGDRKRPGPKCLAA